METQAQTVIKHLQGVVHNFTDITCAHTHTHTRTHTHTLHMHILSLLAQKSAISTKNISSLNFIKRKTQAIINQDKNDTVNKFDQFWLQGPLTQWPRYKEGRNIQSFTDPDRHRHTCLYLHTLSLSA